MDFFVNIIVYHLTLCFVNYNYYTIKKITRVVWYYLLYPHVYIIRLEYYGMVILTSRESCVVDCCSLMSTPCGPDREVKRLNIAACPILLIRQIRPKGII